MHQVKITCDSTCDLTQELYQKYAVEVIPLGILVGEQLHKDGIDITEEDLFSYVDKTGVLPKTSAISIGEYTDIFQKYKNQGYDIVHINISSKFSSCYQNAVVAAQEFEDVYPIDSYNLSSGSGHLVLLAAQLASQGLSAKKIAERLMTARDQLDVSFVIQTLEYLHKGGRCSGVVALGANLLRLKPEIVVSDGGMIVGKKYRGGRDSTIRDYIRGRLEGRKDLLDPSLIFVTHTLLPRETVQMAIDLVHSLQPQAEVIETVAGSTISSHCGPGTLGVLFFKKTESSEV